MAQSGEPRLDLFFLKSSTKTQVGLSGHLTSATVPRLAGLLSSTGEARVIELDLSELTFVDDDGLRALSFLERRCTARGLLLVIGHPRPFVRRLLYRAGVHGQLAPSFPVRRVTGVKAVYNFTHAG